VLIIPNLSEPLKLPPPAPPAGPLPQLNLFKLPPPANPKLLTLFELCKHSPPAPSLPRAGAGACARTHARTREEYVKLDDACACARACASPV